MGRMAAALVIALAGSVSGACRSGQVAATKSAAPVETPAEVVTVGKAVIEKWRQAYEVRSIDALAKLYAHESDLVIIQEGVPLLGWSAVEPMLTERLSKMTKIYVRLKDVQVAALAPTVATITATMTRELQDGVTTVTENGALTITLRRTDDAWLIVAEHYSYKRPS